MDGKKSKQELKLPYIPIIISNICIIINTFNLTLNRTLNNIQNKNIKYNKLHKKIKMKQIISITNIKYQKSILILCHNLNNNVYANKTNIIDIEKTLSLLLL